MLLDWREGAALTWPVLGIDPRRAPLESAAKRRNAASNIAPISSPSVRLRNS